MHAILTDLRALERMLKEGLFEAGASSIAHGPRRPAR
jgi:hypothetical protein